MSEISAEISAIFRVSEANEAIFEILSRLLEKSPKIGKYRRYIGEISESGRYFGRNFDTWETRAWETFFVIFWEIYRRYIGNIGEISEIYRRYIGNIGKNIGDISRYIGIYREISEIYPNDQI